MPSFETAKKKIWGVKIPYGTWIYLSYEEADILTSGLSQSLIAERLSGIGIWGTAAAFAIILQQNYIRELNEQSDHQGVRLLFLWATGLIVSVERRSRPRVATPIGMPAGEGRSRRPGEPPLHVQ